jgi:hypothetical protein
VELRVLAFAVLAVIGGGVVAVRAWQAREPDQLDGPARDRITERLEELRDRDGTASPANRRTTGPRLRLWLDASAVLVAIGVLMVVDLAVTGTGSPRGGVLGIAVTPAPIGADVIPSAAATTEPRGSVTRTSATVSAPRLRPGRQGPGSRHRRPILRRDRRRVRVAFKSRRRTGWPC